MRTDPQHPAGFTLIELMLVVAIIAIIASIAIPSFLGARLNANEAAAISTLKSVASAQAQCRASTVIDANRNGTGEYGYLAELAGSRPVRSDEAGGVGTSLVAPPVLSVAFGTVTSSCTIRSGYVFQMWLPSNTGLGIAENASGGGSSCPVDALRAETMWCAYAWPTVFSNSGKRAFFVNHAGDILASRNNVTRYSGIGGGPLFGAAFLAGSSGRFEDAVAANATGIDSERWTAVN